ncbi:hypothetical protein CMI37_33680 [Candidatus Pacearchaeota archaeon]|nr:hypothetical protein [Candidatus Pacearchaeota archaeon]|tara:strand:+ start:2224 stop:2646 length:423 start_codon:yes stop_codon:yes gene_type:complete
MNVIDASLKIYEWFGENDSFSLEKDFSSLMNIVEDPERDKAAILCALESLEKYEMIKSCAVKNKKEEEKYWVINRPLESVSQNIEIDYQLALFISEIVNKFSKRLDRKDTYCDPSNISTDNLRDLTFIASFLMGDEEEKK